MSKPWKPHSYQLAAVQFILSRGGAAVFYPPGTGKSSTVLAAFKILQAKKLVRSMLIVAPLRVALSVWRDEKDKWSDFEKMSLVVLHGPHKNALLKEKADIFVTNYEGLPWLAEQVKAKRFALPDMLIADEVSKLKHPRSVRSRTLRPLLDRFRRRVALTGTPASNGLMDLFGEMLVVDQGASLGRYLTHFRNEYFVSTGYGGYTYTPKRDAEQRIFEAIKDVSIRIDEKDWLDLPELTINDVFVDLPSDARAIYAELEEEMTVKLGANELTAVNAAALVTKLRQVANGAAILEGSKSVELHTAKVDACVDLIEEMNGQPCVVFYSYVADRDRLLKVLPKGTPYIGGGVSAKRGQEIVAAFQRGEIPVLLMHPLSGAHGLNLFRGRAVIWFSLDYDLDNYEQGIKRVHRQGQTQRVIVHRILARGTIDHAIAGALSQKDREQRSLLDLLRAAYKPRA